jgi:hypothetical protein
MFRAGLIFAFVLAIGIADVSAEEIVRYRLTEWKRQHLHDAVKGKKIMDTLTKLGCEIQKEDHNGHIDLKYRCPEWKQLELKSHDDAHKWESWLKSFKFETEHKH